MNDRIIEYLPGVDNAQEANSKTCQMLSNKNKTALLLIKVEMK